MERVIAIIHFLHFYLKVLFLNASKMLKEISDFNDLINGYTYFGNELDLDDEWETPNSVVRFYYAFGVEDGNGDSNVKIRIVFGYDDEDTDNTYSYDYYDFLIKTNKKRQYILSIHITLISHTKKNSEIQE